MKRLPAMHDCPLLPVRAATAISAAFATSALAQHDERVGAAQLEDGLLDVVARDRGDRAPRRLRSGEGDGFHPTVGDDVGDRRRTDQESAEGSGREAAALKEGVEVERGLRNVRGVLENARCCRP